ncbi:hypothetical protein C4D60_Mb06t33610 [Musa balbisiana]|uniref:Uncharacterized protein n=1 Tax=Musa balbisiana TaxID=52838 RepID=A0A4S8ISN8_MUSBA|nr:hypothetical protein C4D60_Mb06t33610 [Musa balbisiana]
MKILGFLKPDGCFLKHYHKGITRFGLKDRKFQYSLVGSDSFKVHDGDCLPFFSSNPGGRKLSYARLHLSEEYKEREKWGRLPCLLHRWWQPMKNGCPV